MSMRSRLPAALLLVAVTATACSSAGGSPAQSADGSAGPTTAPSAVTGAISHPTGADEIVLRLDDAGGMLWPEWFAAHAPTFTLFGDGTVVFASASDLPAPGRGRRDGQCAASGPRSSPRTRSRRCSSTRSPRAGSPTARAEYQNPLVADASTAVFEINADGIEKTVSVVALGMEDMEPNADTAIKQAMNELATRLRDFDAGGSLASVAYEPPAYRGTLTPVEGLEGVTFTDWPWTDLAPSDFAPPEDPMALPQGTRVITPEQAAALGIEGFEGGIPGGIYFRDDAGKTYSFALRPLLPGETE